MAPLGIGGSTGSTQIFTKGEAKLWVLLVGINEYQDSGLPSLRYPALDCQGLGEAIAKATEGFPRKEVLVYNDFTEQTLTLSTIRGSLQRIVEKAKSNDTIFLYFSGHGVLEPNRQEPVLCFGDTRQEDLLNTGLPLQELVKTLGKSQANQQLLCLDTCHSGDIRLLGNRGNTATAKSASEQLLNPTPQLMDVLRQRASQSKGFCALLSCDQGQQSWEFPELGHGVFTYYLMEGILGGAADSHGVIEADGLYKYVYRKTLQYIDKLNQQLRLINQQKILRGDNKLHQEYPLQTPKRIVEGVGELILGLKPQVVELQNQRRALMIDGIPDTAITTKLSRVLAGAGDFEVEFISHAEKNSSEIRSAIQGFLRSQDQKGINTPTSLLYLRGHIQEVEDGEAWFVLSPEVSLSRSWLRQELRRAPQTQQIIVLDCPGANSLASWIEDLQCAERGQCLIAAASSPIKPNLFANSLLETLVSANPQAGLPIAKWINNLQALSQNQGINLHTWLSATQAVIDILPGNISKVFQSRYSENETEAVEYKPQLKPPVSVTQSSFILDLEKSDYLSQLLGQLIGPIASAILNKTVKKVSSYEELVEKLTPYIQPEQQQYFQQQAFAILEKYLVVSQSKSSNIAAMNTDFINQCEHELTYLVGPIANFIIQQVLQAQKQISIPEFVQKLSAKIPNPQQALEFKRKMLDLGRN